MTFSITSYFTLSGHSGDIVGELNVWGRFLIKSEILLPGFSSKSLQTSTADKHASS